MNCRPGYHERENERLRKLVAEQRRTINRLTAEVYQLQLTAAGVQGEDSKP